tara:strand:+ start:2027 stop:2602 length:576 start_codon:yes stop_codon:yes gene_type:complete
MFAVPSILSFFFYVSFVAIWIGLTEINIAILGLPEDLWRSFLFLPHAVRVLSAVYLGWLGFPGLLLGHLLSWYVIFDDITIFHALAIIVSACGCNLAVLLLQSSYIGPRATNLRSFNEGLYRHVFLVGLVGSLIISTVNGIFLNSPDGGSMLDPMMTLRFIVGDMLGLVVTIFLITLVRAYVKSYFPSGSS